MSRFAVVIVLIVNVIVGGCIVVIVGVVGVIISAA